MGGSRPPGKYSCNAEERPCGGQSMGSSAAGTESLHQQGSLGPELSPAAWFPCHLCHCQQPLVVEGSSGPGTALITRMDSSVLAPPYPERRMCHPISPMRAEKLAGVRGHTV